MADRFEDVLQRLGEQGQAALRDSYRLWQEGYISRDTFEDVSQYLLEYVNEQSAVYGRMSYAALSQEMTGRVPELSRVVAGAGATRLRIAAKSLETVLASDPATIEGKLERLGNNMPMQTAQLAYEEELKSDTAVEGWTRGMNDDACQLCQWWYRDGRIWPKEHSFQTHSGCRCQQVPEWSRSIAETKYTRALIRRRGTEADRERVILDERRRQAARARRNIARGTVEPD